MKQSKLQFSDPSVEHIVFDINHNFEVTTEPIQVENNYQTSVKKDASERTAFVELPITIGNKETAPFYVELKIAALFFWDKSLDVYADQLLATNAPAMLMGYARPIVAFVTNQSKFPVYNLPFCDFTDNINGSN